MHYIIDKPDFTDFKPRNYAEMDEWINSLPSKTWVAVLGAYSAEGMRGVIAALRGRHSYNIENWTDVDLRLYLMQRKLTDFKERAERQ